MPVETILLLIDAAAKLSVVLNNSFGADSAVAKLIEDRKKAGAAAWTPEARAEVERMLLDAKAYAAAQLALPDAGAAGA